MTPRLLRSLLLGAALAAGCGSPSAQSCNVASDCTQPLPSDCMPSVPGAGDDGGEATCAWICSAGLCEVSS